MSTNPTTIDSEVLARAEQLANSRGCSLNTVLADAIIALEELQQRQDELRREIQGRIKESSGRGSRLLDLDDFRATALHRRNAKESS